MNHLTINFNNPTHLVIILGIILICMALGAASNSNDSDIIPIGMIPVVIVVLGLIGSILYTIITFA